MWRRLASHDYLTSLPNRMAFYAYVNDLLDQDGLAKQTVAICVVDLNRFKPINDQFGHYVGDLVLQEVARRLLDYIGSDEMIARIGGDEFAIALVDFESIAHLRMRLEAFVDAISAPYTIRHCY
jgi:diguanylate cyclase (GGDEF)-like protein